MATHWLAALTMSIFGFWSATSFETENNFVGRVLVRIRCFSSTLDVHYPDCFLNGRCRSYFTFCSAFEHSDRSPQNCEETQNISLSLTECQQKKRKETEILFKSSGKLFLSVKFRTKSRFIPGSSKIYHFRLLPGLRVLSNKITRTSTNWTPLNDSFQTGSARPQPWFEIAAVAQCNRNHYGPKCETFCEETKRNFCDENGTKICTPGRNGSDCDPQCPLDFCKNGGTCMTFGSDSVTSTCQCAPGYSGEICEKEVNTLQKENKTAENSDETDSPVSKIVIGVISAAIVLFFILTICYARLRLMKRKKTSAEPQPMTNRDHSHTSTVYDEIDDNGYNVPLTLLNEGVEENVYMTTSPHLYSSSQTEGKTSDDEVENHVYKTASPHLYSSSQTEEKTSDDEVENHVYKTASPRLYSSLQTEGRTFDDKERPEIPERGYRYGTLKDEENEEQSEHLSLFCTYESDETF